MEPVFKEWLENFIKELKKEFGKRIEFIGLQGSYARGEEGKNSDIDVVVIFDKVNIETLKKYDKIISKMNYRELICGFVSGKDELINWDKSDLFQFYYDTIQLEGSIDFILPLITKQDIKHAIVLGACNIYHMCSHNIIHEKNLDILKNLYKSASFVLQAKYFYENNIYLKKKTELSKVLIGQDKNVINEYFFYKYQNEKNKDFYNSSEILLNWSSYIIKNFK